MKVNTNEFRMRVLAKSRFGFKFIKMCLLPKVTPRDIDPCIQTDPHFDLGRLVVEHQILLYIRHTITTMTINRFRNQEDKNDINISIII